MKAIDWKPMSNQGWWFACFLGVFTSLFNVMERSGKLRNFKLFDEKMPPLEDRRKKCNALFIFAL